jgi:hypothetical protein
MRILFLLAFLLPQVIGPEVGRPPFYDYPGSAIHYPGSARTPGLTPKEQLLASNTAQTLALVPVGNVSDATAQSFHGLSGAKIIAAQFHVKRQGSPSGNVYAKLYDHDGGTFGVDGEPTGAALATSDAIDITTISTIAGWVEFVFSTPYTLGSGDYFVSAEYTGGNGSNQLHVEVSGNTHEGNRAELTSGVWYYDELAPFNDLKFKVFKES